MTDNLIKLSKLDRKILSHLDNDARIPVSKIAKKHRTSSALVSYKINRLRKENIILGSYAMLDLGRLGYSYVRIFLKFQNLNKDTESRIISHLLKRKDIGILALYQGAFDMQISLFTDSFSLLYNFIHELTLKFGDIILQKRISLVNEFHKLPLDYLYDIRNEKKLILRYHGEKEKIDKTDIGILRLLSDDARISIVDISKKLNISINTAKNRKRSLEKKKIIAGYASYINFKKLGYQQQKVFLTFNSIDQKQYNSIRSYLEIQPNIISVNNIVSDYDLEFEIDTPNHNVLNDFLTDLKSKYPDSIKKIDIAVLLKEYFSGLNIFTHKLFLNP